MVGDAPFKHHIKYSRGVIILLEIHSDIHSESGPYDNFVQIDQIDIVRSENHILIKLIIDRFQRFFDGVEILFGFL